MTEDATEQQRRILKSLWEPHPAQRAVMDREERFRIVVAGRRWGKSVMAAHEALGRALETPDATVWWVAPTYDQANKYGFNKIEPLLSPDITAESPKRSKPREITLVNGSTLSFRSAEREDSLRGGGVNFLVIDEAGSVPDRAWKEELRPTLSDTMGDVLAIGTPKRRNWFYEWYRRGDSPEYEDVVSFRAPTEQNPHVADSEVERARRDMPEREFRREYKAEFLDESGGVFTELEERALADYDPADVAGERPFGTGVDFARSEDYTVICTLDGAGRLVHFDRVRGVGWPEIQRRVERAADEYPGKVALDATRDNKIVSDLEDAGVRVVPVNFSGDKRDLIHDLVTAVESEDLTLPDMDPLVHELQVYERETTETGNVRYHAPSGFHDDCVDALALAYRVARTRSVGGTVVDFGKGTVSEDDREREQREAEARDALEGTELGEGILNQIDSRRRRFR